jgi:hypothetical protein
VLLIGCRSSAPTPAVCQTLQNSTFGTGPGPTKFVNAVYNQGWERTSITTLERLNSDAPEIMRPWKAWIELSPECDGQKYLEKAAEGTSVSLISGTGHFTLHGFVIDCLCSVKKLEGLSPQQMQRLEAGY